MDKKQVSYRYCENYAFNAVKNPVEKIFFSFPELNNILKPGIKVLIKPNLIAARHPDRATTVHPAIIRAVVDYLSKYNCEIVIGDSPAGTYNSNILEKLYKTCELTSIPEDYNCKLNYDCSEESISLPHGKALKKLSMIKPAVDADFIINIAKLKTHGLTRLTCATKNLFGVMPGVLKFRQHLAMSDIQIFSQMLIDISAYFDGRIFNLVDGIVGMEGEGPTNGDPIHTGALFGGWDSQSVDVLACHIMGININTVPTLKNYKGIENINLINSDGVKTYNYELPPERARSIPDSVPKWVQNLFTELTVPKPIIVKKSCKKCNICVESCPPQIIKMQKGGAHISTYTECIKCYCCQETCPHKAITLSKPFAERVVRIVRKFRKKP